MDIKNNGGSINMDVVANWIQFHFIPTAPLEYIKTRIKEIERSIKISIIGDVVESNEASKNELQIEKSISVLENNKRLLDELLKEDHESTDEGKIEYIKGALGNLSSDDLDKIYLSIGLILLAHFHLLQ